MNGGEIIVQQLKKKDVKVLFTLCGGHIAPIYVAAEKAGLRVIDVRNEATAVFAADAVARLSGITGVAVVTAGPGLTNSITAMKNAQMAHSPILVFAGATATLLRNRGALQDIDQVSIVSSLVKKNFTVSRLKQLAPAVQQAISIAGYGVRGPVYIECPVDLLFDEVTVREWYSFLSKKKNNGLKEKIIQWYIGNHINKLFKKSENGIIPATKKLQPPAASNFQLKKLTGMISKAKKPVLVLGSAVMANPTLAAELAEAIKKIGIPTYLSGMARGLLGHQHPIHFHHKRKAALKEADLIILAGLPCDFRLNYGNELSSKAKKVTINNVSTELKKNISPNLAIHCQPANCILSLYKNTADWPDWSDWKKELKERELEREKVITEMSEATTKNINPVLLFRKMEELLPENSIIVSDGGDFAATSSYILHPRKPLSSLDSGVFGTLGVGAGFAIGAALCHPGDYIFIVYGDGSAGYSLAEFDTFTKLGLKVCAIVGNNGAWEQVARDQVALLGSDTATVIPRSDYQLIAKSFGADGERTETIGEFEQALKKSIESMNKGVPYLINAIIGTTPFREGSISI